MSINEGVKLYQSRIQHENPSFSSDTSSKAVLPDGTSFDTFDPYPFPEVQPLHDSKQFKRIARLLDNAFKWSTPKSRTDIVVCGGALRDSPTSVLEKQICKELKNMSSSTYVDWDQRKVRSNLVYPEKYCMDFSHRRRNEMLSRPEGKNEVFVGLSIVGSLCQTPKCITLLRQEYEEYGGLGFVSRSGGQTHAFSGVMVLNKKVQNRFYENKSGISRVSIGQSSLISLLLCFQRSKYSVQLNLIAHHIGVALLGRPDDALGKDERVENVWITSKGDELREHECEKTVKISQDMTFSKKEEKEKHSHVIDQVLSDFTKREVVVKMPSRNEKHKSDWQTVVDSNNGNVWYVVFERNIARILIISLKNTTRITVSLECHLYYSPISLNVTKTLTPTLEHRYLNKKNNEMTYSTPFPDMVISIGSLYLRVSSDGERMQEMPLVQGSSAYVKNTTMLSCEVPRNESIDATISNLGTKIVEHPIARGFQVDGMLKGILNRELPWIFRSGGEIERVVLTGSPYLPSRVRTYVNDIIFGTDDIKRVAMYTPSVLASLAMVRL